MKSRVEAVIDRDDSIDDSDLLQELNRISEEESERRSRARYAVRGGNGARNVNVNQITDGSGSATPLFRQMPRMASARRINSNKEVADSNLRVEMQFL